MSGYGAFARYYDELTANVDYRGRALYYAGLIREHSLRRRGILLDLACGTGSLSYKLADLGFDVIGVDASGEMLSLAAARGGEKRPLFLCQSMEELDLYGTVDACVCALDSLNHLKNFKALKLAFKRVSLFLAPGGVFAFDLNTEFKHRHILANNVFVRETDKVFCVWRNELRKHGGVDISLDFFERRPDGRYLRSAEQFTERLFSHREILSALRAAGLDCLKVYGYGTKAPPKKNTR
ncbi:MAG: class I SAM-dependent methyltransferase, partial [Oscillospiraceae bacterium]|nr:class I SAM-dependent methyltransferase [Oscillospiraceae bacterium]